MKPVSEKTRLEMAAGARSIKAAEAWAAADRYEKYCRDRSSRDAGAHVQVLAARATGSADVWVLETSLSRTGQETVRFPAEPLEGYPSDMLRTQLMLVLG